MPRGMGRHPAATGRTGARPPPDAPAAIRGPDRRDVPKSVGSASQGAPTGPRRTAPDPAFGARPARGDRYQRVIQRPDGPSIVGISGTSSTVDPSERPAPHDDPERPSVQRMASSSAQGQEDVAAAARPAVGRGSSTISRLIRGDRMPSLGTATKLARGLRELRDDADTPQYLGLVAAGNTNPTARVEYALRADELLSEPQVRQIMEYYLAVRMRRYGRSFQPSESATAPIGRPSDPAGPPPLPARSGSGPGPPSARCVPSRARSVGIRGVTEHTPGHDPDSPSTIRVSGQRTPASGAPAFAIPGRGSSGPTVRALRSAVEGEPAQLVA